VRSGRGSSTPPGRATLTLPGKGCQHRHRFNEEAFMTSMDINRPDVVAEVEARCAAYDDALMNNRVEALMDFFWESEHAVRFGVTEELYGADEINAFRKARVVNFHDRRTVRESVTTFGDSLAISNLEFSVTSKGQPRHGRQSQVWVKFPGFGWRIVSAHVSHRLTPDNAAAFDPPKG
jgi:ketosteroid isomerase-like protein